MQLFLDCDGVLADFDKRAFEVLGMSSKEFEAKNGSKEFWKTIHNTPNFFQDLDLMPDARLLMDKVQHLNPVILTGVPRGGWAEYQKLVWGEKHFPGVEMVVCSSVDKRDFACPGDIIIDDTNKYRHLWIEIGGVWITHTCAETSLKALWAHDPFLRIV